MAVKFPDEVQQGRRGPLDAPITYAAPVTPSDSVDITFTPAGTTVAIFPRCLHVGTGGDVVVDLIEGGVDITYKNIPSGNLFPRRVKRVKTTSTATDIVAEW